MCAGQPKFDLSHGGRLLEVEVEISEMLKIFYTSKSSPRIYISDPYIFNWDDDTKFNLSN
jgi:hypothetical protein